MKTTKPEIVGLTQLGVDIFNSLGAIYRELMILERPEQGVQSPHRAYSELLAPDRPGEEMVFYTIPGGPQMLVRRFEDLWRRSAKIERKPLYEEILGELTDRPREMEDLARRLIKKGAAKSRAQVRGAVGTLFSVGVLTGRPEEIYVLS